MNDQELAELFADVMTTCSRDTLVLVGELHRRLANSMKMRCDFDCSICHEGDDEALEYN